MYNPSLGRFIQPDELIEDPSSQGLNIYSYVRNSPVTLTDPTARCVTASFCYIRQLQKLGPVTFLRLEGNDRQGGYKPVSQDPIQNEINDILRPNGQPRVFIPLPASGPSLSTLRAIDRVLRALNRLVDRIFPRTEVTLHVQLPTTAVRHAQKGPHRLDS